jgi:hypothetical protein
MAIVANLGRIGREIDRQTSRIRRATRKLAAKDPQRAKLELTIRLLDSMRGRLEKSCKAWKVGLLSAEASHLRAKHRRR